MADMDLDFDGPSKVPTRQARFAPKSSKLKPQIATKPKTETQPSSISTKKEELGPQPPLTDHLTENGAAKGNDDVPLDGEKTGNDVAEEQVAMETDNDEDEVVREIDVCFTPSFDPTTQLYVFQYPLRPVWRPYELEERCQEVRLRPSTAEMEVDLAIDFDSKNFDRDSVHAATMKKQTLSTSWMPLPTCASEYAVGVLIGDKSGTAIMLLALLSTPIPPSKFVAPNRLRIHCLHFASFEQIRIGLRTLALDKSFPQKGYPRKAITAAHGASDAPPEEIEAVINQVAVNIHGVYVLKSSPDNPQYDAFRKVVIDLLMAEGPSAKLKKATIIEAAKLQLGRDINPVEFQKVMKELCNSENSAWVLKRGDGNPQ
ncbi:uncharacterized protein LOC132047838 [Lycium ferocissimum]|uniref:uncharacterized protein LOC132047838 n=1 Tax=Lycium ferocissimum TaxID=112874 RepID=UPI002814EFF5|nr:uncharacterized protein LOC132047838 [Lycium ferocissimum]